MSHPPELVISDDDDTSHVSTPILTHLPPSPSPSPSPLPSERTSSESAKPTSVLPSNSHLRLPVPTPSANSSQTSFAFVDVSEDKSGVEFDDLPPEVASADISIAPDGSFVETSSGQVAHELKKRYDRIIKIDKDHRSPYAITAFVNQHGKQMYRVGHRGLSAPAADAEQRTTMQLEQSPSSPESRQGQTRRMSYGQTARSERNGSRKSRMSMHALLPGTMFPSVTSRSGDAMGSTRSTPLRKLRKTCSNPLISADPLPSSASGRGHSQSVTAADLPRLPIYPMSGEPVPTLHAPPQLRDGFADVMRWETESGPSSPISSHSHSHSHRSEVAPSIGSFNPFGSGVSFESPASLKPSDEFLQIPLLREMQSFESGMTARADAPLRIQPPIALAPMTFMTISESFVPDDEAPSFPPGLGLSNYQGTFPFPLVSEEAVEVAPLSPTRSPSPPLSLSRQKYSDPMYVPTDETMAHTRYPTEVFDVLQTYRGLPVLERLLEDSADSAVIRMTLTAEDNAAPRNDPRFVIWGTVALESHADGSQASRRSSGEFVHLRVTSSGPERERVLVAGTIERWLAQLTSALDYDELLVFFLTYRSYITALDLCYLLTCRFHWALGRSAGGGDEMVRRVVRVRTFVAIRYWLLTFFAVDFVPNRELRVLFASWLNTLRRDPILQKHTDATSIVRKLMSVARDAKEAYSQRPRSSVSKPNSGTGTPNGASRKSSSGNDEDLDLDFIAEPSSGFGKAKGAAGGGGAAVIQQPLHRAIIEHRPSLSASVSPTAAFPAHPASALSRALANTVGRLGRWKRALNPGSRHAGKPGSTDVSAFDLELNPEGDFLQLHSGMSEQYLNVFETHHGSMNVPSPVPPTMTSLQQQSVDPLSPLELPRPNSSNPPPALPPEAADTAAPAPIPPDAPTSRDSPIVSEEAEAAGEPTEVAQEVVINTGPPAKFSLRARTGSHVSTSSTSSSSSYGVPVASQSTFHVRRSGQDRSWQVEIVSIDDLDFSDTSSDVSESPIAHPGLKRLPRRLPLRRDFEFVDRNRESVSSMGFASQDESAASASNSRRSSAMSGVIEGGLGTTIQQWQVNALIDSLSEEDDNGDVEDALRRLEGQMNPQKQRARETKVDNWVRTIRERLAAGDYGNEAPRYLSDEEDAASETGTYDDTGAQGSAPISAVSSPSRPGSPASVRRVSSFGLLVDSSTPTPGPGQSSQQTSIPSTAPRSAEEKKPAIEDVLPPEILRGRLTAPFPAQKVPTKIPSTSARLSKVSGTADNHRSWVLGVPTAALAIHFSMIDRELFLAIKFEEVVSDEWRSPEAAQAANVLDWGQFLKDRARLKAQGVEGYRTSALVAARARFNLLTNFVISEIVDTAPAERPSLASKFIRVAWQCYRLNSFSTLVAIVAGLRSDWVSRAMKRGWERVIVFNLRILKDLTFFTDPVDDFKHIREAVSHLTDPKLATGASEEAASVRSSTRGRLTDGKPPTGVPFLGIYLAPLQRVSRLPDLIDPTAPTELVTIDPVSGNFSPPAHPEVFDALPPLPPVMHLEPLINVHKQRLVARTVKALVSGQHLASRLQYPIDRRLFQRCLRLRGLDSATLHRKLAMHPD